MEYIEIADTGVRVSRVGLGVWAIGGWMPTPASPRRSGSIGRMTAKFCAAQMAELRAVALHASRPPFDLFERDAERDVFSNCPQHGVVGMTYGALCRGLLSGRLAVARLDALARDRFGKRVINLAVRWLLEQPGVGVALRGARKPSQLDDVEGAMDFTIDRATRDEIDRIVAATVKGPVGPEFMAPPTRSVA